MTPNPLTCTSEYLSGREALLLRVDMSAYLIDYYLHRKKVAPDTTPEQDEKLKEIIACFAMHLTGHASAQSHGWTIQLISQPPYSLFVTGSVNPHPDTGDINGQIVGNILTEHIRHTDINGLHAQVTDGKGKTSKSYVQSESADIGEIVEHFYAQSEQQPLRIALSKTSDTAVGLLALPGYDQPWFESAKLEELASGDNSAGKQMRVCRFTFACDCSPQKLIPFFRSIPQESVNDLYGADDEILITCPRCGEQFPILRSDLTPPA